MGVEVEKTGGYHHGDLREALIEASLDLIEEGGVQALSLRRAARQAGVSPAAPYHHFQNRAALLAAVAGQGFELLYEAMQAALDGIDDPAQKLTASGAAYVRFARAHSAHFRVMFRPELADKEEFPELEKVGRPVFDHLARLVLEAQGQKAIPEGDPQRYVLLAWATAHGISSLVLDGPLSCPFDGLDFPEEELGDIVVNTLCEVLRVAARR